MLIHHTTLRNIVQKICVCTGASVQDATQVADSLVDANLMGHDSHGVGMLPKYISNFKAGNLHPKGQAELTSDQGAILQVNGQLGYGQVVGPQAIELGIERCKESGVAIVALRNAHHLGRIGALGEQCTEAGLISLHYVNVVGQPPKVAPFGGIKARLSTNPFCCAVPVPGQPPLILDMATSAIAQGKIRVAKNKKQQAPEGVLLDPEGLPTTDPNVMFSEPPGALTHFGTYKGFGLAVICEILAGALASNWSIQPGNERPGVNVNNMLTILMNPDFIGDRATFEKEMLALISYIKSSPTMPGTESVMMPGEPEQKTKSIRLKEGISIDETSWDEILDAAEKVDLKKGVILEMLSQSPH